MVHSHNVHGGAAVWHVTDAAALPLLSPLRTALHAMVREGNNKAAVKNLQDLFAAINRHEPKNADLYYRITKPFSRLAGADAGVLTVTLMMAERAMQLKPEYAPYVGARLGLEVFQP